MDRLPFATRRSHRRLIQNGDATGQPVDVNFVLALARGERDTATVAAAVGKEVNRARRFGDEIALRGEQLHLHFTRQRVDARVALYLERPMLEIEQQASVG